MGMVTSVIMCKSDKRMHFELVCLFSVFLVLFFFFAGVWWPFSSYRLMPFSSTVVTHVILCKSDKIMHFERV